MRFTTYFAGIVALLAPSLALAQGPAPVVNPGGVVSASAFGEFTSVAPGSWIEIYGSNLAPGTRTWTGDDFQGVNAPESLDGTSATIGGQPAYVSFISANQMNVQVPSNVATGPQSLIVTTAAGGKSSAYTITVNAEQPGLLAPSSFILGGNQYVVALFPDNSTYVLPPEAIAGLPSRRAQPGDTIIFYGVGFGAVTPGIPAGQLAEQLNTLAAPFHLFFGSTEATLAYDGLAPGYVGLYQFNVVVPNIPSSDQVPLTFTLAGTAGDQALFIAVQNGDTLPAIKSVTLSAPEVASGGSVQGAITLADAAPPSGAVVTLSSNSAAATVPASVTVPAGSTSATFTITAGTVSSNQTVTITATYAGSSAAINMKVTAPVVALFSSVIAPITFQPVGYPSGLLDLTLTPDAGNLTYTGAVFGGPTFIKGTATNSGQTFTFNSIQQPTIGGTIFFGFGSPTNPTELEVSSGSLVVNFSGPIAVVGSLSGTLSVTGTPFPAGGAAVTITGAISGSYLATIPH